MNFRVILVVAALCLAGVCRADDFGWTGNDLYGVPCHGLSAGYGPYDYNDPKLRQRRPYTPLWLVESAHFTKHVQLLLPGTDPNNNTTNEGNLDYVLRAFPNHHRALWTMMEWYIDHGRPRASQSPVPPAECWLQRAIAFRPKDAVVYRLYATYLHLAGFPERSIKYYKESLDLDPTSAEAHYNYGLALVDSHRYQEALLQARRAYDLGYPLPGLRDRLKKAGYTVGQPNLSEEKNRHPAD